MGNQNSAFSFKYFSAVQGPEFDYNPEYNQTRLHSDYTYFYVGIGLCLLLTALILALNIALGCCSPWRKYWANRDSGNRLVLPLFITPPKDQQPILM